MRFLNHERASEVSECKRQRFCRTSSRRPDAFIDLASILARGVRRFLEKSRPSAVSSAENLNVSLDVTAPSRPHVGGNEAA